MIYETYMIQEDVTGSQKKPRQLRCSDVTKAHVFDVGEFGNPVFGTLATESRLLDPAERRLDCRNHTFIDSDHPELETLGDPPNLTDVV